AVEYEQHRRRGHVAVVPEYPARIRECAISYAEDLLERREHLGSAGMADEAIDIRDLEAMAIEELRRDVAHTLAHERRDVAGQSHLQSVVLDVPAHDVERVGPGVLAGWTEFDAVAAPGK